MAYEKEIKMLQIKPGEYPQVITAPQTLKSLQSLVDGDIEVVYPWKDDVALVVDDCGKLNGKPLNRPLKDYDVLAGTILVVGLDGPDFKSLREDQIKKYEKIFHQPYVFIPTMKGIHMMPCLPRQYEEAMEILEQRNKRFGRDER